MIKKFLLASLCTLSICSSAFAQEAKTKLESPEYSPDFCEFTATFPEEPYKTHKCESDDKSTCYDLISFTKVFDLSATLSVEIICNPSTTAMYQEFTPEVMETTVRAMTKDSVLEAYEVKSRQDDQYRQAGLLGRGKKGLDETIYIAQLWIAQGSIMSVEAEISGEQIPEADKMFADILSSIGYTEDINKNKENAKKDDSNDTKDTINE